MDMRIVHRGLKRGLCTRIVWKEKRLNLEFRWNLNDSHGVSMCLAVLHVLSLDILTYIHWAVILSFLYTYTHTHVHLQVTKGLVKISKGFSVKRFGLAPENSHFNQAHKWWRCCCWSHPHSENLFSITRCEDTSIHLMHLPLEWLHECQGTVLRADAGCAINSCLISVGYHY